MLNCSLRSPALLPAALLALCLLAAHAQNPPASPAAPGQSHPAAVAPNPNDELLARAARLYYSSAKAGLDSFDCAVHPDWRTVFVSAEKSSTVAEDDPRIVLLKKVNITLHGRLKGGSTLDWNPPAQPDKPLDQDSTSLLANMHSAIDQTLQGFMQFWTPFVDGSAIPSSSDGLQITQTENGYTLHAEQSGVGTTEQLDKSLVMRHVEVILNGTTIQFDPAYMPTDKGLLVNKFLAHIQPQGAAPEQAQVMHVSIEYQVLSGFPIPARLYMDVVNNGTLNFVLDGCSVNQQAK
jgi:hypothetical protein